MVRNVRICKFRLDEGVYVNTNGELVRHAVLQWGETPYAIGKLDHVFLAIQSYSGIIFELFRLFLLVLLFIVSVFLERRYYLQSSY